jgi:8-oxo-dGTP pyrophosphatase MutT (NUDIX family)
VKSEKKIISFDFDNTVAITYIDIDKNEEPNPVFLEYNQKVLDLMNEYIENGDDVYIVTSRYRHLEQEYPQQDVPYHLDKLNLSEYFWPDKVFYMNGGLKTEKLQELGVDLHFDDSMEEVLACKEAGINVKNPLDFYKDANVCGKSVIYDASDRILLLQRSDEGTKWDLPGGHIKEIELERGQYGLQKGLEREVAEETGIILPNETYYYDFSNTYAGKTNQVHIYLTKMDEDEPKVDLNVQDFQENINYKWVSLQEIEQYLDNSTTLCAEVIQKIVKDNMIMTTEGKYLASQRKNWRRMKTKLIGMGGNKHTGGGKGHTRPSMSKGKAAPPDFAVLEEEEGKKKGKIKIKIVNNEENLDEKKKKRKKKRKKSKKSKHQPKAGRSTKYFGSSYFDYGLFDGGSGDSGAGDGGGGE